MSSLYFGCDVDLTIVRSDLRWLDWLYSNASKEDQEAYNNLFQGLPLKPYNLGALFPSVANPMDYWNTLDYSQFEPIEGSVDALARISTYFPIVFQSHVEGTGVHAKSKYYWLKKHYPFMEGFLPTREKYLMNRAIVGHIDDRYNHLKKIDLSKRYLFKTAYTQEEECLTMKVIDSWTQIDADFVNSLVKMWR